MNIALVRMPYTGSRNVTERSAVPAYLDTDALHGRLRETGVTAIDVSNVRLDERQEHERGRWHRMGLACGNLATRIDAHAARRRFVVGLLGNCTGLLGMLAGLRRAHASVGMLFLDAHGDFNTPETTLSGMLGGMPVAVAAGLCLHRLRREAGLEPPVSPAQIVMAGLRDVDPLERALIDEHGVEVLTVDDLRGASSRLRDAVQRLASAVDAVYLHVDMDVLDPAEVPGHHTAVPGGLSSAELAAALDAIVPGGKFAALGIASTPPEQRDAGGVARDAAHRLITAVVQAVTRPASEVP